ncbi:cytochrome c oxidase assembly protein COX16, partial [Gorgonomyces haynaldii]
MKKLSAGLPLLILTVCGSFGLTWIMQTKYDLNDKQNQMLSKREQLELQEKKPVHLQELYFELTKNEDEDYEMVRVP